MAFRRKRRFFKRRRFRKRRFSRRRTGRGLRKAFRAIKGIKRLFEHKYFVVASNGSFSSAGSFVFTPLINQGATSTSRIGNECIIKTFTWRGEFFLGDTASFNYIRFTGFWITDTGGRASTDFNLAYFFEETVSQPWLSPFRVYRGRNFKILWDKHFLLHGGAPGVGGSLSTTVMLGQRRMKIVKKINRKQVYTSGGSNFTDLDGGCLVMCWISDSGAIPNPSVQYTYKMSYIDP